MVPFNVKYTKTLILIYLFQKRLLIFSSPHVIDSVEHVFCFMKLINNEVVIGINVLVVSLNYY